ncbi:hypothetical protein EST38_g10809 [Candolleomyces aberdarensis]|uniref:Uncharacterized protein n=1 Tax=Candolleomyces aberdarensis TaxID=2316362 RepID=A0A4Q2D8Q2_9AGAR|nr:hypothetical protein EST38_g10809 [Candolleomyces aberdarensis]
MSFSQSNEVKPWRRNREYRTLSDGRMFSRKIDPKTDTPGQWEEISPPAPEEEPKKQLYLILEDQLPGEPRHWSLFACIGETAASKGKRWQVTGDATFMHYQHDDDVAVFAAPVGKTYYTLNNDLSEDQEKEVEEAVEKELPPSAPDRASVKEHCQGWTIRVLRRLERGGVVKKETVDWIERDLKEPIVSPKERLEKVQEAVC